MTFAPLFTPQALFAPAPQPRSFMEARAPTLAH
jgi:hypothetical protein